MHPTADTTDVMLLQRCGAAGDAGRYAAGNNVTSIMKVETTMPHVNFRRAGYILLLTALAVTNSRAQVERHHSRPGKCPENQDRLYSRRDTLQQFADILNASIPEFERVNGFKFALQDGEVIGFQAHDLTDPSNAELAGTSACIKLIDNHIYHVVPLMNDYSFSHIIILEGGKLKVFRSLNCRGRGDKLEDVVSYLNSKLAGEGNKDEIIKRVINYRKYGTYVRMDNFSTLRCQSVVN